jgi:glycerol-3-phosphate acyltransferase PlsY
VLGHNWPVYFRFKGGKGMLTAAAVMVMIDWRMTLISLGVFVAVIAVTRFVSLGTICAAVVFVGLTFAPAFGATLYFSAFAALMALTIVFKHRENIRRLLSGTENKLKF